MPDDVDPTTPVDPQMPVDPSVRRRVADLGARMADVRLRREATERAAAVALGALQAADAERAAAAARGLPARQLAGIDRRREAARLEHDRISDRMREVKDLEDRIRRDFEDVVVPLGDPLDTFAGDVPIALLPVRLETRFGDGSLRVRIYPDTLHVDQHEPLLSQEEESYGRAWWTARWHLTEDAEVQALWSQALRGRRPGRVAWVLEQTAPTNLDGLGTGEPSFGSPDLRASGPSRAPRAQLLPTRWVVVGYRGGEEVLRRWTSTVADPLVLGMGPDGGAATDPSEEPDRGSSHLPDEQDALSVDDELRWATDYDRAVAAGMAVTVPADAVEGGLDGGLDRLIVIGVSHRGDPAGGAAELEAALRAHRFTSGLDHVAVGTSTNADDEDALAARPVPGPPGVQPAGQRGAASASGSARTLARALGLDPDATLGSVGGADTPVNPHTEHLHTVLWESTLGYFLRQMMEPVVEDDDIAVVRDHFRQHVRPRGPLPLLRVGSQPYGVLPVTSLKRHTGDAAERMLTSALRGLRPLWLWPSRDALQLGSSGDPGADLVRLLERTSRSARWRMREAFGPGFLANTEGMGPLHGFQQLAAVMALGIAGLHGRPRIVDVTLSEDQAVLPVPLVTGTELSDLEGLADDYVARLVTRLSRRGGYAQLSREPSDADSLLEALLVHSANLEVLKAGTGLVVGHLDLELPLRRALLDPEIYLGDASPLPVDRPVRGRRRTDGPVEPLPGGAVTRGQVTVEDQGTAAARLSVGAVELANQPLASLTGKVSVADWVIEKADVELARSEQTRELAQFRTSLRELVGVPTRALHEGTAETLDAVSHRYDAWVTSLATRRLDTLRDAGVGGVHVGAFGWVENLRPSADPGSHGYVHAPSVPQATTAAVLRSGHLARGDDAGGPLAVDLSSRRVRTALKLVDGLRGGQSLGALLGYRFERALRDRDVELVQYVLPLRQRHPLPTDVDRDAGDGPVEAIAARNVVDGAALADLDAAARTALLDEVGVAAGHRDAVLAEVGALADAVDALADLLLAESVHQVVVGNTERAAAALDALDRQQPVPDVHVSRTSRTGTGVNHRLLVVLDDAGPPAGWAGLGDVRSAAAPRVNAWVARVLGDPARYRFAADVLGDDGAVLETVEVGLADLKISALSAVLAAVRGGDQVSELEERLAVAFAERVTATGAAGLAAHDGPAPGAAPGSAGLSELALTARRVADLVSSARGATLRDLAPESDRVDSGIDVAELALRAGKVRSALETVAGVDPAGLNRPVLARRLHDAADLGIRGALPRGDDLEGLRAQMAAAAHQARRLLGRLDAAQRAFDERAADQPATDDLHVQHHTAQIQAVLGEDLPVVPRLTVPTEVRSPLSGSASDSALLDGAALAPTEFLLAHARVRPAVARLWDVLTGAELAGTGVDATQLLVAQLPHRPGDRWVGRPLDHPGQIPHATTSLVAHRTGDARNQVGAAVHALVVDQWNETIPHPELTTGLAFHHDAPGARPPQSVLLAVPPDPDAEAWRLDVLVDIVNEAFDLARMRTLDGDDLPLAGRLLPATYLAFNLERAVPTFDIKRLLDQVVQKWGHVEVDR